MTTKGCEKMTAMRRAACAFIATLVLIGMAARDDARSAEPMVIATASPGGPYLAYGQGLARILSREFGQEVTAQSTQGPAQNVLLLERKQATLAFITMGVGLMERERLDRGDAIPFHAGDIPDVRHRVSVCGSQAPSP